MAVISLIDADNDVDDVYSELVGTRASRPEPTMPSEF